MQNLQNLLIVSSLTFGGGFLSSLIPSAGIPAALIGSSAGSTIGIAITNIKQYKRLAKEKQGIEEEIIKLKEQSSQLESQIKLLLNKFNIAKAEQDKQELDLIKLNKKLNDLTMHKEVLEIEIGCEQEKKEKVEAEVTGLKEQLNNLNIQTKILDNKLSIDTEQKKKLETELIKLNEQLTQLTTQREGLIIELSSDVEEKKKLETKLIKLNEQLNKLSNEKEAIINELRSESTNLGTIQGQLSKKQEELQQVIQQITNINNERQELEGRFAVINKIRPQITRLEQLQADIEKSRLEKSGLEGQIEGLSTKVNSLEEQQRSLSFVETELNNKKIQLEIVNKQTEQLEARKQNLEQQAVEIELLRVTYDSLFSQQQNFEQKIHQLRPEIDRLEAEKQRILKAIQEHQLEYQQIEKSRQAVQELKIQVKAKETELREIERDLNRQNGIQASLEEKNAKSRQEKEELEVELKHLRADINNIGNDADIALRSLKDKLWLTLPTQLRSIGDEQQFLDEFTKDIRSQGLVFPKRVIQAFHTSLKVQDISALVILAGISGTGKSELPQRYADYIGAQLLTLAVQPRWDSPQDLLGFYNYMEKKFKPTDLMRGLYQYNHDPNMKDRMVIVLLDEMNLARVEYYFSEFLSKLETRRSKQTELEIDVGSLPIKENDRRLQIPKQFLFVGTMNEDETTQSLSDKVLDRANVLTFGKPQKLQLRQERITNNNHSNTTGYLAYSYFEQWIKKPVSNPSVVERVKYFLDKTNLVMENMKHPFAHRVYQAITEYVINYPGLENEKSEAFKFALADQFGQKILPKLRGVMVEDTHEELEQLKGIIAEIDDASLITAFDKARKGRYGQFFWQGLVYQDE